MKYEIPPKAFEEKMESDAQKARDNRSRILKNAEETIEKLKTAEKASGKNSCLTGNITCRRNEPQSVVYLEVSGVDGTNCFMYGNITITSTDEARLSIYGACGEGSVLQGNVSFKGIFFDASVYGATEGQLIGNIDFASPSGDSDAYIIGCSGENSKMSGSINVHVNKINEAYAMFPRVTGIEKGDN